MKYLILIAVLMDAGTAGPYCHEIWQKTHLNCELEFLIVEYRRYDYYEISCALLSQEFKRIFQGTFRAIEEICSVYHWLGST